MVQVMCFENAGTFHTSYCENIHFYYVKSDFNIENVKRRKEVVFIFVIGVGRINDVLSTIRCQVMDFVILGR